MSWTFAGQLFISLAAVATLFITARALGPANLGILALVESFVRIVDLILRIEPWQAVMRYAIQAEERGDDAAFMRLIKLSVLIDAAGGLLSGSVCIILGFYTATWIGLPADTGPIYIAVFAIGLFISFRPTATAVLRIYDRFDVLARIYRFLGQPARINALPSQNSGRPPSFQLIQRLVNRHFGYSELNRVRHRSPEGLPRRFGSVSRFWTAGLTGWADRLLERRMKALIQQNFDGEFEESNAALAQMMDYDIEGFGYQLPDGRRAISVAQ